MKTSKLLTNLFFVVCLSVVFSACGKKADNKNNAKANLKIDAEKAKKAEEEVQLKQKKEVAEKERIEKELKEKVEKETKDKELANQKLVIKPSPSITPAIKEMPKSETLKPNEQTAPVKPATALSPAVSNEPTKVVPSGDSNPKNVTNADDEVPPAPELDIENEKMEFCVLNSLKSYADLFKKDSKTVVTVLELNKVFTTIYEKCKTQGAAAEVNSKEKFMVLNLLIVKINEVRPDLIAEIEKLKVGVLGMDSHVQGTDQVISSVENKPQDPEPGDAESILKMTKATAELKVSKIKISGRKIKQESDEKKLVYDVKQTLNQYDLALSDIKGKKVSKTINFEVQVSSSSESESFFDFSFFKRLFNMESKSEVKWKYELDVEVNQNGNYNLVIDEEGNRETYEVQVLKGNIKDMINDETGKAQVQVVMTQKSWSELSQRLLQDFVKKESADTAGVLKNFNLKTEPNGYARTCNLNSFSLACSDPQYLIRGEN